MNLYFIGGLLWASFGEVTYTVLGIILVFILFVMATSKLKEVFGI